MRNEKFKNQIKKNKEASTSTETIVEALYEEEPKEVVVREIQEPKTLTVNVDIPDIPKPAIRRPAGRPRGEETIQKTVYIPKYLWPFVQAAIKKNGGNMQSYFGSLLETDINKNREKYKELAEIYRTLDGENV